MWAESVHISDEEGDEDAAKQGHGRGRDDHHDHASRHVDQRAEPRPHNDLSQLDHAGERGAVHPGAPLALVASSQLHVFLETQQGIIIIIIVIVRITRNRKPSTFAPKWRSGKHQVILWYIYLLIIVNELFWAI